MVVPERGGRQAGSCPSSTISTAIELCLIQTKWWLPLTGGWRTAWEEALAPLRGISVGGVWLFGEVVFLLFELFLLGFVGFVVFFVGTI